MARLNDFDSYPMTMFKDEALREGKLSWLQNPRDPKVEGSKHFCEEERRVHLDWSKGGYDPLGFAFVELMERDLGGHPDYHAPMQFNWIITSEDFRSSWITGGQVWTNTGRIGDEPLIGISFQIPNFQSLGFAIRGELVPPLRTARPFNWSVLDDEGFERLMFRLFFELEDFDNVQWLQKTRAADSGRDISAERLSNGARVMIQARHQKVSINATAVNDVVVKAETWNPKFDEVIIVTTSAFTQEAIRWVDSLNANPGERPTVVMEPSGHLEVKLSSHPELISHLGLR